MSDTDTISVSQLIELVRDRTVLWDRQKEVYKNRKLTRKAWVEICEILIENYEELNDQEQKAIGRSVISKWANLRDNWLRYWRKRQQLILSGSSTTTLKKYIHHDQLLFLSKVYDPECQEEVEEIQVDVDVISDPEMESSPALSSGETSQNMWSFQEEEVNKHPETDHHVYFFHSVLPLIKDFDDEQTIDFQMAIFECIKRIRVKTVNNQFYSPPHCHISYQNQKSIPQKFNMSSTEHTNVYSQECYPQQEIGNRQRPYGPSFQETAKGANNEKKTNCTKTTDENKSEIKQSLTQQAENSCKISHDLTNLNKAISKLDKISKKISASSLGDSYDHFGRHVVSLLRRISPKRIKFFKRKLIRFITNHLNSDAKKPHLFDSSQETPQTCNESQESIGKRSKNSSIYQNKVNTLENSHKSTELKSASEPSDSYQVSTHISLEEPTSSSHISNHTFLIKNVTPTTIPKLNQMTSNKRKKCN